jgi:hypothetical protein
MNKRVRTTLSCVASVALLSAVALAKVGGRPANSDKKDSKEHHSPFAKAAFWRHHGQKEKDAKKPQAKAGQAQQGQAKAAHVKAKTAKQANNKSVPLQKGHAGVASKASAHKAPAQKVEPAKAQQHAKAKGLVKRNSTAKKAKPHEKGQHRTAASVGR